MTLLRPSLLRRAWIVGVCVVLATGAVVVAADARGSDYFRAYAVFEVPANGGAGDVTRTSPQVLASTYLDVIVSGEAIADRVAKQTGVPISDLGPRLKATEDVDASVVRVSLTGPTAAEAVAERDALVRAIEGRDRVDSGIPAGGLFLVSGATPAVHIAKRVEDGPLPVGIILGLIVGLAALIAWDRVDPRIDDVSVLRADLGLRTTVLEAETSDRSLEAMALRWRQLAGREAGITIVLVPGGAPAHSATVDAAARLRELGPLRTAEIVVAEAAGGSYGSEPAVVNADLLVLVEQTGGRLRSDRQVIVELAQFGLVPHWALLVTPE